MPRPRKKPRHPPTEGAYTLHDFYGEIGASDLKKMVPFEGKPPTKEVLVDALVRSTPPDGLHLNHVKQICGAFGVFQGGKKEDCLERLKKLLKQDAQNAAPAAVAAEEPKAAGEERLEHEQDKESCASSTSRDRRAKEAAASRDNGEKIGQKRRQNGNIAESGMIKTKQAKEEAEARAKTNAHADDFSIKMCISVLNTMDELSSKEKAESFDLFKDAQNREIFVSAEPIARLLCTGLRRKIDTQTASDSGCL